MLAARVSLRSWPSKARLSSLRSFATKQRRKEHEVYFFGNAFGFLAKEGHIVHPKLLGGYEGLPVKQLALGYQNTFILADKNRLFAFGNNENGQLGIPFFANLEVSSPVLLQTLENVNTKKIVTGRAHSVVLTEEGEVFTWGTQEFGQLGNGVTDKASAELPTRISSIKEFQPIVDISCGFDHTIALTSKGEVLGWGFNQTSQLGLGTEKDSDIPMKLPGIEKRVKSLTSGLDYNLAITVDGDWYAWGGGETFQLGTGEKHDQEKPYLVSLPGEKVTQFAAAGGSVVALCESGAVYSWGTGMTGRLGHGSEENCPFPTRIEFFERLPSRVIKVSGKGGHYLAQTEDGELYSWGLGRGGRLGHFDETNQLLPKRIEFFKGRKVIEFEASVEHSVVAVEEE